ncbi:MAG: DUF448 domain-containing protein [Myxococcota bacterium]
MERTCIVTREPHDPDDLVRIVAVAGVAEVDYRAKLGGRGAWVLPRREVLERLKPGMLARALEVENVSTEGLLDKVRAANQRAFLDFLSLSARAGLLASGGDQVVEAARAKQLVGLLISADASPKSVEKARASSDLPVWTAPLTTEELGRRVGKGPRSVIGLRDGGATRALARELRRMQELR